MCKEKPQKAVSVSSSPYWEVFHILLYQVCLSRDETRGVSRISYKLNLTFDLINKPGVWKTHLNREKPGTHLNREKPGVWKTHLNREKPGGRPISTERSLGYGRPISTERSLGYGRPISTERSLGYGRPISTERNPS
uniref:Uncharacterized protein n=1 Tax=Oncorhynchus tshawytscha TaxID=74940 RepID=A0AAZ3QQW6_ONCTS